MEETTLSGRLPENNVISKSRSFNKLNKNLIVEVICFLLMLYFFYEGIFKVIHIIGFEKWLSNKPYVKSLSPILAYTIPVVEIVVSIFMMLPRFRKTALYFFIATQLLFIIWIWNMYPFKDLIFSPYHSYLIRPKWFDKMISALLLCWMAVIALYLLIKTTQNKKSIAQ